MPDYTTPHSIRYPLPDDFIRDGRPDQSALVDEMRGQALTVNNAISAEGQRAEQEAYERARWYRSAEYDEMLLSTTDIYSLAPGVYRPISPQAAEGMGLPTRDNGSLEMRETGTNGRVLIWWPTSSDSASLYTNQRIGSSNWTGWKKISGSVQVMRPPMHVDELEDGSYINVSNNDADDLGLPARQQGPLTQVSTAGTTKSQVWIPISMTPRFYTRSSLAGNWSPWHMYTPGGGDQDGSHSGAVEREMRVAQASARRGGTYGTDGKAVLSLVFDHGTNNFLSKVVPILEQYQVPATLGLNSRMYDPDYIFHQADNETTWEQIQDAAIKYGFTVWNHGMWHKATGPEEVIGGRDELQDALPEIPIEGWLHTGAYGDFNHGATFASYWQHDIGAVIMNAHAYLTGDIQEPIKPLTGQLKPGFDGQWVDGGQSGLNIIQSMVEDAQQVSGGVMLRHHPMYLDEGGYITSQQLEDFIAWAASERDAGRLLILTADLMNHADAGRSYRRNLLPGDGGSRNQTRTVNLSRNAQAKGSVNELHAVIDVAEAGTVQLIASADGLHRTQQFDISAGRSEIRMFFTIPLNATGELSVTVGQLEHIDLEVEELNLYPA